MWLLLEFLFDSNKILLDRFQIMIGIPLAFFLTRDINPICMNWPSTVVSIWKAHFILSVSIFNILW